MYVSDSEVNGTQAIHIPPTGIQCSHKRQLPQLSDETGIQMYTCRVVRVHVCLCVCVSLSQSYLNASRVEVWWENL